MPSTGFALLHVLDYKPKSLFKLPFLSSVTVVLEVGNGTATVDGCSDVTGSTKGLGESQDSVQFSARSAAASGSARSANCSPEESEEGLPLADSLSLKKRRAALNTRPRKGIFSLGSIRFSLNSSFQVKGLEARPRASKSAGDVRLETSRPATAYSTWPPFGALVFFRLADCWGRM